MSWLLKRRNWLKALGCAGALFQGRAVCAAGATEDSPAQPPGAGPMLSIRRTLPVRKEVDVFIAGETPRRV